MPAEKYRFPTGPQNISPSRKAVHKSSNWLVTLRILFFIPFHKSGTLVVTKVFQFSTDRTAAGLKGVPAEE